MNKEGFPLKDLPIEELVEGYLSLPDGVAVDLENLPEDLDYFVIKDGEDGGELHRLVQDGLLDPESADSAIKASADFLKEGYPEHKKSIDIIYLFDRGKIWIAHSMYLQKVGAHKNVIERAQEKTVRLFLRIGLVMGVINPLLSGHIYNSLCLSGYLKQAEIFGAKCLAGVCLTKDKEEAVRLAQKMGETNPTYYKDGFARISQNKLDKSGLN